MIGVALVVAAVGGTLVGTLLGRHAGTRFDAAASVVAVGAYSIPVFWLGLMMILVFSVTLGWFPSSGMTSPVPPEGWIAQAADVAHHLVLPAGALATVWFGEYVRLSRASVSNVLAEDYITAARGTGYSERNILVKHALRNAMLPITTVFGLQLAALLAGAVLTETVFAWPGLGRLLFDAVLARDMPVIMGAYIAMSVTVVIATLLTDIAYARLDPRVVYR
nr:ABC transporter permease [Phytoactinopolyspora alkaliphila]